MAESKKTSSGKAKATKKTPAKPAEPARPVKAVRAAKAVEPVEPVEPVEEAASKTIPAKPAAAAARASEATVRAATSSGMIRIKLVRSLIGSTSHQRAVVAGLGLRRLNHTVERKDTREIRGMVAKVPHLVSVLG